MAEARLAGATGPARFSIFEPSTAPLTGRVTGPSFSVMRTSQGRNSFRPVIRGTIEPAPGGSRIHGTMRLHEAVLVFLGFLILGPVWFFLGGLMPSLREDGFSRSAFLIPAAALFLVVMAVFGFALERRRALAILTQVLEGEVSG